jgi:hypothetical protein
VARTATLPVVATTARRPIEEAVLLPTAATTAEALLHRLIAATWEAHPAIAEVIADRQRTAADLLATAHRPIAAVVARCRPIMDRPLTEVAADPAPAARPRTTVVVAAAAITAEAAVADRTVVVAVEVTPADITNQSRSAALGETPS